MVLQVLALLWFSTASLCSPGSCGMVVAMLVVRLVLAESLWFLYFYRFMTVSLCSPGSCGMVFVVCDSVTSGPPSSA